MREHYLAELRDMRAFSANDSQKPALDWAIERLQPQQDGAQGCEAVLYAAAEKGFHISETCGPDGKYWHISKFQSLADLQAYEHAWRDTMLAAKNQRLSRPAIAPQACNCPGAGKADPKLHAPNCPARAPQATPAAVDDAMVERAFKASRTGWHQNERTQMRAALEAALAAPPAEVKP